MPILCLYVYLFFIIIKGSLRSKVDNIGEVGFFAALVPFIVSMAEPTFPFGPGTATVFNFILLGAAIKSQTIKYEEHSYKKENIIIDRTKRNEILKIEIDNDIDVQKIFFKYIQLNQLYNIMILHLILKEKYGVKKILYSLLQYNNYKKRITKTIKYNGKKENMVDSIKLDIEKLLKYKIEYLNEKIIQKLFEFIQQKNL